jgi:hypothetical protein
VDFHLEHRLRLVTAPEHENLYAWAINEIDGQAQQIGPDQIPWPWTLRFIATSCELRDSIKIKSKPQVEDAAPALAEIEQAQIIRAELRPGIFGDEETAFSMFGTGRMIERFQLEILPIANPAESERCHTWGSVSYTTEIDFRDDTSDDCIVFYLFVKSETFASYAEKIASRAVDELILGVKSVDGFYSEWSPSVSTSLVKVLTGGKEQAISLAPGFEFEPPRLGRVGTAELWINRRIELSGN